MKKINKSGGGAELANASTVHHRDSGSKLGIHRK
jgi:hypothetical protein